MEIGEVNGGHHGIDCGLSRTGVFVRNAAPVPLFASEKPAS